MRVTCILLVYSISKSTHPYSITGDFLIRYVYNQAVQAGPGQPGQRSKPGRPAYWDHWAHRLSPVLSVRMTGLNMLILEA